MSASNSQRYAKRGAVIMPVEPPYEVLRFMAGDPVILSASDEQIARAEYADFREQMKAAQEMKRK